jgi:hypothetical protein
MYEGRVFWENHTYYLQDDCSFPLYSDDLAGMTQFDVNKGLYQRYLHSEFDSDETINHFHSWFWDQLHKAVDADTPVGNGLFGCSAALGATGGILSSWDDIRCSMTKRRS